MNIIAAVREYARLPSGGSAVVKAQATTRCYPHGSLADSVRTEPERIHEATMSKGEFWHVIWTTHGCWKPEDERGEWNMLGDFYKRLSKEFPEVRLSRSLPKFWRAAEFLKDHVCLNDRARDQVGSDIRKLTAIGGDRVAGNTPVIGIAVGPNCVQLVISCNADELSQKVGRLKSRTATLLSFVPETETGGKSTWGKGFWYAGFHDPTVVSRVVAFVGTAS